MIYADFLASKAITAKHRGMDSAPKLKPHLFPFQRHCVDFALRCGSAGLFLSTGLGKTACELEWAIHAALASNGKALILTPLAVARQIEAEAKRWSYPARVIRSQEDAAEGINICNYDRMGLLEPTKFEAIVLDESSIIKNFTGKTSAALIAQFSQHRWRLSATATPAPNDHQELGTQSEFLGVMSMNDMLVRWFINDSADTGTWRLKGYAREPWDWMASWCRMADHPRDLGDYSVAGYDLPELRVIHHRAVRGAAKRIKLPTIGKNEPKGSSKVRYRGSRHFRGAKMSEGLRTSSEDPTYLSPSFAELVMGYPIGHTELVPSETPSSHKSQPGSEPES